jgi:hypothetical protein
LFVVVVAETFSLPIPWTWADLDSDTTIAHISSNSGNSLIPSVTNVVHLLPRKILIARHKHGDGINGK